MRGDYQRVSGTREQKKVPITRKHPRQPDCMVKKQTGLQAVLQDIERGPVRSTLFYWMAENHDELLRAWTGRPIRWATLCARFETLGLTDRDGGRASERTARMTWLRVRKAVRKARAFQMSGVRQPSGGRATSTASAAVRGSTLAASVADRLSSPRTNTDSTQGVVPRDGGPVSREVALAKIAAFQKTLDERSGR